MQLRRFFHEVKKKNMFEIPLHIKIKKIMERNSNIDILIMVG